MVRLSCHRSRTPSTGTARSVDDATGNELGRPRHRCDRRRCSRPVDVSDVGLSDIPGAAGRVALATKAATKQLRREVVEAAGRGGGQAVRALGDKAAVEALGIAKPGLRFGTRNASVRLPGPGALEEALSGALNRARAPLTNTGAATQLRKWGAARDLDKRAAVERLLTGKGSLSPLESAAHILQTDAGRVGERTTGGMFVREATDIGDELKDDANYVHMLEAGDLSHPGVARLAGLQDEVFQWQTNTGKWDPTVNPNAPINNASVGQRPNRVPHVLTEEGREVFGHENTIVPGKGAAAKPGEHQYSRVIVPGVDAKGDPISYKIGGHDFTPTEGSIREANDWAASVGLPKLYEDSPRKLAAVTVEQAQEAVGNARRYNTLSKLRVEDPNDPTNTVPAVASAYKSVATEDTLDKAASVAAGQARATALQPELERLQGKTARSKTWLDQTGSDIVANLTRENQIMFDIAGDLDQEARAALTAANKAARKLGDPDKAIQRVYAEADRQITKATDGLARSQKKLDDVIERQRQLELGNRRSRADVRRSLKAERTRLEAEVADATEVLRARDAMGAKLRRTIKREAGQAPVPDNQLAERLAGIEAERAAAVEAAEAAAAAAPPPTAVAPESVPLLPRSRPRRCRFRQSTPPSSTCGGKRSQMRLRQRVRKGCDIAATATNRRDRNQAIARARELTDRIANEEKRLAARATPTITRGPTPAPRGQGTASSESSGSAGAAARQDQRGCRGPCRRSPVRECCASSGQPADR